MRRAVPAWWRGTVLAVAGIEALALLPMALPGAGRDELFAVWALGGLGAGLALVFGFLRHGGAHGYAAAAGAFVLAGLAAFLGSSPMHLFAGLGAGAAIAVLHAFPDRFGTPLAAVGYLVRAAAMFSLLRYTGPIGEVPAWHSWLLAGATSLFLGGLLVWSMRIPTQPGVALGIRGRLALVAGAAALLSLGWLIGGSLWFLPLWPLPLAMLLVLGLLRWRDARPAAWAVLGIALAGFLPAGTCVVDPWSDAIAPGPPDADAYDDIVLLMQAGGHGPRWASGGGFTGIVVDCPLSVELLGGAWALALLGAAAWAATRPGAASVPRR